MDYIRQSLGRNEELIHVGRFHTIYTVQALFGLFLSLVAAVAVVVLAVKLQPFLSESVPFFSNAPTPPEGAGWLAHVRALPGVIKIAALIVFLIGIYHFVQMMIVKLTTKIAVTNRRVIYKRGLVARYVGEINIKNIEGITVLQSLLGRLLGYGRLAIRGFGIGEIILPPIAEPIRFRRAIDHARELAEKAMRGDGGGTGTGTGAGAGTEAETGRADMKEENGG